MGRTILSSPPRKRGGGVTFEVQQIQEDLGRGLEVEAFSGGVVIEAGEVSDLGGGEGFEVGLSGQDAAEATDGVFDAAFLPGCMRIAEESLYSEVLLQRVVA